MVAPRPPPAATPSRYGSASGLRNTPWYAAPPPDSMAPTSAPSTTRGSRICQTMAVSIAGTATAGCQGSLVARASATSGRESPAGPTDTPTASAITSRTAATRMARAARPEVVGPEVAGPVVIRLVVLAGPGPVVLAGAAPSAGAAGWGAVGGGAGRCPAAGCRARRGPGLAPRGRLHPVPPLAIAVSTVRSRSVTRGPHREAMSSLSPMMWPSLTAVSPDQPGRLATVAAS